MKALENNSEDLIESFNVERKELKAENADIRKDRRDICDRLEVAQTNYINAKAEVERLKRDIDERWKPLLEAAKSLDERADWSQRERLRDAIANCEEVSDE